MTECFETGKQRFSSPKAASAVIKYLKQKSRRGTIPKRSYFCKHCKGWHLTSEDQIRRE